MSIAPIRQPHSPVYEDLRCADCGHTFCAVCDWSPDCGWFLDDEDCECPECGGEGVPE